MKGDKETKLNKKIEDFFFSFSKNPENYRNFFMENGASKEQVRFSPLYLITRDISYCFGLNPEENNKKICENFGPAEFAGILLIFQAIEILCNSGVTSKHKFYRDNYSIGKEDELITALGYIRNGMTHDFYSPSYEKKGITWHFMVSIEPRVLIEKIKEDQENKTKLFHLNHIILFSNFYNSLGKLKKELLDTKNIKIREEFDSRVKREKWVMIGNVLKDPKK